MDNQTAMYAIAAIAIAYTVISTWIMQKIGNPNRVKEIQKESQRLSKAMGEAVKSKDDKRIDAINKEYEKFMPQMGEMMMLQFKPLIIILPIIFIITPIITSTFAGFAITLPFSLPIFIQNFEHFPNWRSLFGPIGWFWICVIFAGLAVSIIKSNLDKRNSKKKEESGHPAKPKEKETATPKPAEPSPASQSPKLAEITNS